MVDYTANTLVLQTRSNTEEVLKHLFQMYTPHSGRDQTGEILHPSPTVLESLPFGVDALSKVQSQVEQEAIEATSSY